GRLTRQRGTTMQLGVFLSHDTALAVAAEAERLGYAVALAPEGFKSDAASVLGAVAARTSRIAIASGVMQLPARTPVMTALTAAPVGADLPVYLAAIGPASLQLAGALADGWIGVFCPPSRVADALQHVRTGRQRAGADLDGFEVLPSVPISVGEDPRAAADA